MLFDTLTITLLLLLPFLCLSVRIKERANESSNIFFYDKPYLPNQTLKPKWMKPINDKVPLNLIMIPGTHDSASYCIKEFTSYAVTQSLTISQQLDIGIRYLDIRLCYSKENPIFLFICHGPLSCKLTFSEVVQSIIQFLKGNPSEGIILKVSNERKQYNNQINNLIGNLLPKFMPYFLQTTTIPTISELRGKFVLMPSEINLPQFKYIPWLQLQLFSSQTDFVYWGKKQKTKQVLSMDALIAQNTNKGFNPKEFYVNEFSASGIAAGNLFDTIKVTAKQMNPVVTEIQGRVGILMFDYPSQELVNYLLSKYFIYLNAYLPKIINGTNTH